MSRRGSVQDNIGHNKKPYRPHGKSISATNISAKTISATKYTSLFGVIVSMTPNILYCVYSPYLEFERETMHKTIGQKEAYRPTSSLL